MKIGWLLAHLEGVRKSGEGFTAKCPAHEDKQNSLKVSPEHDGRILLHCFAGCSVEDIMRALNMSVADIMPPRDESQRSSNKETSYRIQIGENDIVEHIRIDTPQGKRFIWKRNGKMGLGGLRVVEVPLYRPEKQGDDKRVFLCEGEKASIAAAKMGLQAYGTCCGASACPSAEVLKAVCQGKDVILWADNDVPGKEHMGRIEKALVGIAKSMVTIQTGSEKDDAADFLGTHEELERVIQKASGCRTAPVVIAKKISSAMDSLARYSYGDYSDRVPIGIKKIDQALRGGLMPGAVYLIGAPSGHGKTTFLQIIGFECARTRGPALFISPEMSGDELAEREIVRRSGVPIFKRAPWMPQEERSSAVVSHANAAMQIQKENLPLYVIEDSEITMTDISKMAETIEGIRLVIVDYAQEVADRSSNLARYLAVGEVGKESIELGKKLHIPVIVASQVNVIKSDKGALDYAFRETKDLEGRSHAAMIMEINREEAVNKYGFHDVKSARIFARKNRSGPLFDVKVDYKPAIFTIRDFEERPWVPNGRDGY